MTTLSELKALREKARGYNALASEWARYRDALMEWFDSPEAEQVFKDAERCDCAYVNGARFGWNCGVTWDRKKFDEGVANYESLIRDERKEQGHG